MKTVVFANGIFAFPAIQLLAQQGILQGICTVQSDTEEAQQLRMLVNQLQLPFLEVTKNNYKKAIKKQLQHWQVDVVFVMTFPFKIPSELLSIPSKGFYNFHYAKLPEYRGSQPVFWEIFNRETQGAVSVHKMDEGLDTGPLLVTEQVPIDPEGAYGEHVLNLAHAGTIVLQKLCPILYQGIENSLLRMQDESKAQVHHKPTLQDLIINWELQTVDEIRALIKACNPWNKGAFSFWNNRNFKITEVTKLDTHKPGAKPGTVINIDDNDGLIVQCKDEKSLRIDIISIEEGFFTGNKLVCYGLKKGDVFAASN